MSKNKLIIIFLVALHLKITCFPFSHKGRRFPTNIMLTSIMLVNGLV